MNMDSEKLGKILATLITEAYEGPENPKMTWFVDNEAGSGFLGTVERLSAEGASRPLAAGDRMTPASHAAHLRFSLNLANRAFRGENVHASADWKSSWATGKVTEQEWQGLLADLRREYLSLKVAIASGLPWSDDMNLTGILSMLAHGAWHLGALRQGLGLVRAP
jgi:hypothetical protein